MRKFTFLSLCFSALILTSSCTKEKALPPAGNPPQKQPPTIIYSEWTEETALSWSDTSVNGDPHLRSTWNVPGLTQTMIDNGAVLVFARNNSDASVKIFPAMMFANNNNDFEMYQSSPATEAFEFLRSKTVNGVLETPGVNNTVSFRYILIDNAPPANARIATGSAAGFNMEALKSLDYSDLAILLGIPN